MDGTLLDLAFDNDFWLRQVPRLYAAQHKLEIEQARQQLFDLYHEYKGTLNWYCTDFWSEQLQLDIIGHKKQLAHNIALRPGTLEFLQQAKAQRKQLVLVTNAHPDTLQVKLDKSLIADYFDEIYSSHQFGQPKESVSFWQQLEQTIEAELSECLFIDDTESILTIAQQSGVKFVVAVNQPDSQLPQQESMVYPNVNQLTELMPRETDGQSRSKK
ncbi:MAG: GMP/IMP nucleotidase [Kangiellaceae bacterium]|nr:GMP/IMP nucleotidase [Kangiellaceae bacterium]